MTFGYWLTVTAVVWVVYFFLCALNEQVNNSAGSYYDGCVVAFHGYFKGGFWWQSLIFIGGLVGVVVFINNLGKW